MAMNERRGRPKGRTKTAITIRVVPELMNDLDELYTQFSVVFPKMCKNDFYEIALKYFVVNAKQNNAKTITFMQKHDNEIEREIAELRKAISQLERKAKR